MNCVNFTVNRLVQLHEFYQIDLNKWYNAGDSDSDDDSTNLNPPLPQIFSVCDAVQKKPKEAVMALFSHLGIPYHIFEGQNQESTRTTTAHTERKRGNEDEEGKTKHRIPRQRYVGRDGASFSASPTDGNVSSTQSASSRDQG